MRSRRLDIPLVYPQYLDSIAQERIAVMRHTFIAGILAASVLLSPAALANPAQTRSSLAEAVEQENWSQAISLVDRLIDEQGVNQDLLDYRSRLQRLNTSSLLADIDGAESSFGQFSVTPSEAALARELALERERQAALLAREERLAARAERRELRNQERILRAEARQLRALERESLARANAINANQSRRFVCLSSNCGLRRVNFGFRQSFRDRHPYGRRRNVVYSDHHDRSVETRGAGVRIQIN